MSAKKKTTRQKKILNMVAINTDERSSLDGETQHYEEAIRQQMNVIKKDYTRLVSGVAKGYGLVKHWVGNQAMTRGEMIRSRFIRSN